MLAAMTHGTIGWIQVDTDDPEGAERFYGELFNWTFSSNPNDDETYREITPDGGEHPHGGVMDTKGETPNGAYFYVVVSDVAKTVEQAEQLGAKVVVPTTSAANGLTFATLRDPAGSTFGVFTPPTR